MARPLINPDPIAEKAAREAVVALRTACKIPRTAFALMIGMGTQALQDKEKGRLRFSPKEVAHISACVSAHLATCLKTASALDSLQARQNA